MALHVSSSSHLRPVSCVGTGCTRAARSPPWPKTLTPTPSHASYKIPSAPLASLSFFPLATLPGYPNSLPEFPSVTGMWRLIRRNQGKPSPLCGTHLLLLIMRISLTPFPSLFRSKLSSRTSSETRRHRLHLWSCPAASPGGLRVRRQCHLLPLAAPVPVNLSVFTRDRQNLAIVEPLGRTSPSTAGTLARWVYPPPSTFHLSNLDPVVCSKPLKRMGTSRSGPPIALKIQRPQFVQTGMNQSEATMWPSPNQFVFKQIHIVWKLV
jgi:hypothetical protein